MTRAPLRLSLLGALAALAVVLGAPEGHAEPPKPAAAGAKEDPKPSKIPASPEQQAADGRVRFAKEAWEKGDFDRAEVLYREAIERGALSPEAVLECYVRLGSLRSILGKKKGLEAFRAAAILHRNFTLPTEAGKREAALADQARKDTEGFGEITLTAEAPASAPAGGAIVVKAKLDAAHLPVAKKLAFTAHDFLYGKEESSTRDVAESAEFQVPAALTGPGTRVGVRVDALDGYGNRLASVERIIEIPDGHPKGGAGGGEARAKGSLWKTPWPYVVGGAVLAGGAAATYYLYFRPTDQVQINTVTILR